MNAKYEIVIGLEVHAELATRSKLFCRCKNVSDDLLAPPNSAICPVCTGLPGALPVINEAAVISTIKVGHSLGATIPAVTKWDRKNYFYPDLPKGYQISQYDVPLVSGGTLEWFGRDGKTQSVAITRVHLEEDTGKLTHPAGADYSLIDYNRSSIPLLELVTEPVITSATEAREFCEAYQRLLRMVGVASADMEKGQMRCEANISLIPVGTPIENRLSGTKVEVKNLNSFRSLERAILYEAERQSEALDSGEKLTQETRGWDENKGQTYSMRKKESSDDYRYFPEPDLPPLATQEYNLTGSDEYKEWLAEYQGLLELGLDAGTVFVVMTDAPRAQYLRTVGLENQSPVVAGLLFQWLAQEPKVMNIAAEVFLAAMKDLSEQKISSAVLKQALGSEKPFEEAIVVATADATVDNITEVIAGVLGREVAAVADYKAGNERILGFLVGQVKKATGGKGDPGEINIELKRQLEG